MSENQIPDPLPDPMACDPRSRRCDLWSLPIFCCWSLIPYTLLWPLASIKWGWLKKKRYKNFHLRLFLAEMRLNVLGMCNRKEEERYGKPCVTNFVWKNFPWNRSFLKRPENINVKFTTNTQLIALSSLSHTSVLPSSSSCRPVT